MTKAAFDPDYIVPAWVRALAIIDQEHPTGFELRSVLSNDAHLALLRAGLVERLPGKNRQNKATAKLKLTDDGRELLKRCLDVLTDFIRGEADTPGESIAHDGGAA